MTLYLQYIFSIILFIFKNKHLFTSNREIHKYITRNNTNLHLSTVNINKFYTGPYTLGSEAFNDMKYFKLSLKRFLYHRSFQSIEEYFKYNEEEDM